MKIEKDDEVPSLDKDAEALEEKAASTAVEVKEDMQLQDFLKTMETQGEEQDDPEQEEDRVKIGHWLDISAQDRIP